MITNEGVKLIHGDCLEVLKGMPDNSVDSIVTDPPYGLSFMGKKWDYDVPDQAIWEECLRVLKPGGHLLAFAGTRTQYRMAVRIEDAGFEIRDMIAWVYGSGFPKSLDVSKAIDKAAGAVREVIGKAQWSNSAAHFVPGEDHTARVTLDITAPAAAAARQWQGWGTALKPALEPITVARKPLKGTVADNVLEWGTGAINIDGCRVGTDGGTRKESSGEKCETVSVGGFLNAKAGEPVPGMGRWPANVIHDGSDEVVAGFPNNNARFFYCAKASKKDRDEGLDCFDAKYAPRDNGFSNKISGSNLPRANIHPTVKPTDLMAYLCRLVTPPGGVVLDPFMGSGSTGKAAVREGFRFIGIEMDAEYLAIAEARIAHEAGKQTEK